jgi:uncharacterized protein
MTQEHTRPVFTVATDLDNKPYWDYIRQHELRVQKCLTCGKLHYPVSPICPHCMGLESDWAKLSGKGKVASFVVVHRGRSPLFPPNAPYVVAIIETEEGIRMLSNVVGCKPEDVKMDMPVELVFQDFGPQLTVPRFKPVS